VFISWFRGAAGSGRAERRREPVYGAGGVGGYFGGRLAQAGAEVHLIARGAHLQALREHGLRVRSVKGDFAVQLPATDNQPKSAHVSTYSSASRRSTPSRPQPDSGRWSALTPRWCRCKTASTTRRKLARAIGADRVMGGAAFIFVEISEQGAIVHTGGPTSITFGELDGQLTDRAQRRLRCCQQAAGFAAELSQSIKTVLWAKFAFICAHADMTAAVRLPIGQIRTADAAWTMFQRLVAEVAAVAAADGNPMPPAAQQRAPALAQSAEPGAIPRSTTTW
jgi:2-dehydropantoate 2-reductase